MPLRTVMPSLARTFLLVFATVNTAQGIPCLVESTNLGGGLFSYTFQRGSDPGVWGISTNEGSIWIQSYGVLDVQDSPGWTHTTSSSGVITWITWTVTNGIVFLDDPITFSVRSCLTESVTYTNTSRGGIIGVVFELPGRTNVLGGGYQEFDFVGPALPSLSIGQSGTNVTVQWSPQAQGLQLEASDRLDVSALWTTVTNVPAIVDSKFTVELPFRDRQKYFRLVCPCAP
jgi:hypothetical protein